MLNRELIKGSTVILVLTLLSERPMYGYELVKEMGSRSDHELQMKEGTLYPSLHKLERQGYISSYWEKQEKARIVSIIGLQKTAERSWQSAQRNGACFQP